VLELKAQLTVEYLASFITFIGLIIFIYFTYSANIPGFIEEVKKEDVRSKAYQLSEMLVNDPGEPIDWDTAGPIKRIGLSDENFNKTNLISLDKVYRLDQADLCANFDDVKKLLGLNKSFSIYVFNISQSDGDRDVLCECTTPELIKTAINTTVRRITALNNNGRLELAEILVQM